MKDLGKYPTLLEIQLGRKMTPADYKRMDKEYKKAERVHNEYIRDKILAKAKS